MTCFTLPFWQQLLPPMHYVICIRNPLDVALSLQRRDDFSLEKGFYLWLLYTKFALKYTVDQQRIFISVDHFINDWQNELLRLCQFLGKPELALQDNLKNKVQASIDETLLHHRTSTKALTEVLRIYESFSQKDLFQPRDLDQTLQEAIDFIGKEAKKKEDLNQQNKYDQWMEQLQLAIQELTALVPAREKFILVDDEKWGTEVFKVQHAIPFLEKNGRYWGSPQDDDTAIQELERLRRSDASFIVFGWPAFWWLDHYTELQCYLREQYRCILQNDRLIVFDLRPRIGDFPLAENSNKDKNDLVSSTK